MKVTTEWDLKAFEDKLTNTEYFFDVLRFREKTLDKNIIRKITEFAYFSQLDLPFYMNIPIKNL